MGQAPPSSPPPSPPSPSPPTSPPSPPPSDHPTEVTDEAPPPPRVSTDAAPPIATDRPDRLDRLPISARLRSPELDAPRSGAIVTCESTAIIAKTHASRHV